MIMYLRIMESLHILLGLFLAAVVPCLATPGGATTSSCGSLLPRHGATAPQVDANPFSLQIGNTQYVPGRTLTIILTGPRGFGGFLIQARRVGDTQSTPIGTWDNLPNEQAATLDCRNRGDTVTHSNSLLKNGILLTWRAPTTVNQGPVEFWATVAESYEIFWAPLRSAQINEASQLCSPNPCENGGTCTAIGTNAYSCTCRLGTMGSRCQTITQDVESTVCSLNPCQNGATCNPFGPNTYGCSCPFGFEGSTCQTAVNTACSSNPCLNGGSCLLSTASSYQCSCLVGYSGLRCQITACSSSPCMNGGQCSGTTNSYVCSCATSFTGTRCQNGIGACSPNPCFNDGQCVPISSGTAYQCNCVSGYTGANCLQSINPCSPNPCSNNGICTSPAATTFQCNCQAGWSGADCTLRSQDVCTRSNICHNGGTCQPRNGGSFTCLCSEGYDGVDCSMMISPCLPNPCLNEGTCILSSASSFKCTCSGGFTGITCQIQDLCNPSPCIRGVCQQLAGDPSYMCVCIPGYTGEDCDVQALCNPNPCTNGVCTQSDTALTYSCRCDPAFAGMNCDQVRPGPCVENPCQNGGLCIEQTDVFGHDCFCLVGYNGASCEETVLPVFENCPSFQILTYPLEPEQSFANVSLSVTATLPGGPPPIVEIASGPDVTGTVPFSDRLGEGEAVVVRATSLVGATTDCQFLLMIVDEDPPKITCPQDITKVTYGSSEFVEWSSATVSDNLASPSDMTVVYSSLSGSGFTSSEDASPNTILVTATDTFGNEATCSFKVTVVKIPDPPLPSFSGCSEGQTLTYQLRNGTDVAYVSTNIEATDSSQLPAAITRVEGPDVNLPGDVRFAEGYRDKQKFVFRAVDPVTKLTADCTFWIKLIDGEQPNIRCPSNIIERTTNTNKAIWWASAQVEDNLPLPSDNFIRYDQENGTVFEATTNGLSYIVTATARDSFNNMGICQFSITLYRFDNVCSEFPIVTNGSSVCALSGDGKTECRVSCNTDYQYAPVDNRFKCTITSTDAFWDPVPNSNGCIRPSAGSTISKIVTAVFPFDAGVCDASNKVFVSTIKNSVQNGLRQESLCELGLATACTSDSIVPNCGVGASAAATGGRGRRAFTDLTVDVEVSASASDNSGTSLTEAKDDIEDLAREIKDLADNQRLSLIIDFEMVYSITSEISNEYAWRCPVGYKSVIGGCVTCSPGTYYNTTSQDCFFCERGSYQSGLGQTSCRQCPSSKTTNQLGSYRLSHCRIATGASTSIWTPFLIIVVVIAVAFLAVLIIGVMCICYCTSSKSDARYSRDKDLDGSLSNLKYLNKAYEEEHTKSRSKSMHRLGKRQLSPSRSSTATGYITVSGSSRNQTDMVSIDSDDYREDIHTSRHIKHDNPGRSYGNVSTIAMGNNGTGFRPPNTSKQVQGSSVQMRRELPDTGL